MTPALWSLLALLAFGCGFTLGFCAGLIRANANFEKELRDKYPPTAAEGRYRSGGER